MFQELVFEVNFFGELEERHSSTNIADSFCAYSFIIMWVEETLCVMRHVLQFWFDLPYVGTVWSSPFRLLDSRFLARHVCLSVCPSVGLPKLWKGSNGKGIKLTNSFKMI